VLYQFFLVNSVMSLNLVLSIECHFFTGIVYQFNVNSPSHRSEIYDCFLVLVVFLSVNCVMLQASS